MSILKPDLVLLRNGDILAFFVWLPLVDGGAIADGVAFFNGEQVMRHGLVRELMNEGRHEIHATVDDVECSPRSAGGGWWWEVVVEFGVEVDLVLHKAREVRAEDAGFVGWCSGAIVANGWVFAEGDTGAHDLKHT